MQYRKPTQHRMTRRSAAHDYTRPGIYHITLHVAECLGQPLGTVVGSLAIPDGSPDAPHVNLSPIGRMVEQELLTAIHAHYAMITIQDYVVMPDHLHCLLEVQDKILSKNGKTVPLGTVIAGFKKGCNRRYWELIAATAMPASVSAGFPGAVSSPAASVPAGFPGAMASPYKVPSSAKSGRQPLFAPEYCDVMPVDERQLATQRAYIAGNPRSRLQRSASKALHTQRGGIDTALTPNALRGYLRRECGAALTPEAWANISAQLLIAPNGTINCDTFGPRRLLAASAGIATTDTTGAVPTRLLPVVCHRKDKQRFPQQKAKCLEEASQGAVLVSPRIAPGEQEIIKDSVNHGFPVIIIADNGFPERYHPSQERLDRCADGRLLIITPWRYRYRGKNEQITVPFCKAMNCVAQALCRTKDSWWKQSPPASPASACPLVSSSVYPPVSPVE